MQELLNKYKPILFVIGGIIILYFIIQIATPKPKMPADLKNKIDSLTAINKQIQIEQAIISGKISNYAAGIDNIDNKIDNIKSKTTITRNYYNTSNQAASNYTPTQVDSFFKSRYKY